MHWEALYTVAGDWKKKGLAEPGDLPVYLSAQAHLQGYYGRYGFTAVTEVYLDDGIPHIGMRRA